MSKALAALRMWKDIGCGWVFHVMKRMPGSNKNSKAVTDDEIASLVEQKLPPSIDEFAVGSEQLLLTWLEKQGPEFKNSRFKGPKFLFGFLLMTCRPKDFYVCCGLAIWFIIARIFNSVVFSQLMAVLGDDLDDLIFSWGGDMPLLTVSVVVFSVSTVLAGHATYYLDLKLKILAIRCRQLTQWHVAFVTAHMSQASFTSSCSTGEALSFVGGYSMHIEWGISTFAYVIAAPIEIVALLFLSVLQIGWKAAFMGLVPLCAFVVVQVLLLKLGKTSQAKANNMVAQRLNVTNDAVTANTVVKYNLAEQVLDAKACMLRKKEEKYLLAAAMGNAVSLVGQICLAPFMVWISMYAMWDDGKAVSSELFTVLGYDKTIASFDLFKIIRSLQSLAMAFSASDKIVDYLCEATAAAAACDGNTASKETKDAVTDGDELVAYNNVSIAWNKDDEPLHKNLTFSLKRKQLIGISGSIACGKSSLLLSMLGEVFICQGTVRKHNDWEDVAYASQKAWLPSGSVLSNIVFDSPDSKDIVVKDQAWLDLVVDKCGLRTDIDGFANGILQDIGQEGSSLSGGQKARLALARAVYAKAKITILDDVLCALDPALGAKIFQEVIDHNGILHHGPNRTVIVVSQDNAILQRCDTILNIEDGNITVDSGGGSSLVTKSAPPATAPVNASAATTFKKTPSNALNQLASSKSVGYGKILASVAIFEESMVFALEEEELEEEDAAQNELVFKDRGTWNNLLSLYKSLGWIATIAGVLICGAVALIYTWQYALQKWLDPERTAAAQQSSFAFVSRYLVVITFWTAVPASVLHYYTFLRGASQIQQKVFRSVVNSPLSFFTVNPASKVYACLVQDGAEVEYILAASTGSVFMLISQIIGTVVLICISCWYMVFLLLPLALLYSRLQKMYSAASVPIKQTEASKRSPILNSLGDMINGLSMIHSFKRVQLALDRFYRFSKLNYAWSCIVAALSSWLAFWSNVVVYGIISIITTVIVAVAFTPGPSSEGPLILSNVFQLAGMVGAATVLFTNVESSLTSVGRLLTLSDLSSEEDVVRNRPDVLSQESMPATNRDAKLDVKSSNESSMSVDLVVKVKQEVPESWPTTGSVEFEHVTAAYTWDAAPALKDLTVSIQNGTSCAFVGRSGSGKSTSVLALSGMIPIISGRILIDGYDTRDVPLRRLRDGMATVPQEAIIFNGTVRYNLDLQNNCDDTQIWEMLDIVELKIVIQTAGGLDTDLDPQAAILSAGQKQLLALCRALLRDKSVLILDEANASVDSQTEEQMGHIVKQFMAGAVGLTRRTRSVIEIAHRLTSVVERDQVVVLRAGCVLEMGSPKLLAEKQGSEFGEMLKAQSGAA